MGLLGYASDESPIYAGCPECPHCRVKVAAEAARALETSEFEAKRRNELREMERIQRDGEREYLEARKKESETLRNDVVLLGAKVERLLRARPARAGSNPKRRKARKR